MTKGRELSDEVLKLAEPSIRNVAIGDRAVIYDSERKQHYTSLVVTKDSQGVNVRHYKRDGYIFVPYQSAFIIKGNGQLLVGKRV